MLHWWTSGGEAAGREGGGGAIIPPALQSFSKHDGDWIAAPISIHSTNWSWANKAAGIVPLAHGGQPWQDATVFEAVLLATGGPEFYKQALIGADARRCQDRRRPDDTVCLQHGEGNALRPQDDLAVGLTSRLEALGRAGAGGGN